MKQAKLIIFFSISAKKGRDDGIVAIHGFGGDEIGRKQWKVCSDYYERWLVEMAMFKIKNVWRRLKARSIGGQKTELIFKCIIVNRMSHLKMPKFE